MFGKKLNILIVLSFAALIVTVAPACATSITTYTDSTVWTAATSSGSTLIDFQNGNLTNFGVSFVGISGTLAVIDTSLYSWMNSTMGKAAYINSNSAPTPIIRILLPTSVTAFGFYLFTASPNSLPVTVSTLSQTFNVTTNAGPTFFGATSDTPFSSIDVTLAGAPQGTYELVDTFRFGTAAVQTDPTPEAATFLLIGSGLVGLMSLRKRITKKTTALQTNPIPSAC